MFSASDIEYIRARGMTEEKIVSQIERFRRGATALTLDRPATVGDGIVRVADDEKPRLVALHDEAAGAGRCLKFVPASGAATRMFRDWHAALNAGGFGSRAARDAFIESLPSYAFYEDLCEALSKAGCDPARPTAEGGECEILDCILGERGLHYACKPKALLKFHRYGDGARTALEEHLVEAALYVRDRSGLCRLHVTVSSEHLAPVRALVERVRGDYERRFGVRYEIGFSVQSESTDTIAVDLDNRPFRARDGRLLFRPGGHGALLYNLQAIEGDIVFVKNIDNVVPDRLKDTTVLYKKILGGFLVDLQGQLFSRLRALADPSAGEAVLDEAARFASGRLACLLPPDFGGRPVKERREILMRALDRPLRVCGMVKNEGEPGGGPFWVREPDGGCSLQIVEEVQVDKRQAGQAEIWASSTHFNPVDLACGVRDYRGRPFDLERFVAADQVFISVKSHEGRDIKALELPGLWNGSMARWHTVFVEVPIETFNPVKTVDDLLRPAHRP
ncbi:MAG: DUF4301 family protein [Syntrophaceae bacterium]|nr:DUF4301 family protein [Syntrophaceae bacterium]